MTKTQKRKDRKLRQLTHMIAAGLTHVATIFAAVMFAASGAPEKWIFDASSDFYNPAVVAWCATWRCKEALRLVILREQGSGFYGPNPSSYPRNV